MDKETFDILFVTFLLTSPTLFAALLCALSDPQTELYTVGPSKLHMSMLHSIPKCREDNENLMPSDILEAINQVSTSYLEDKCNQPPFWA